MRHKFFKYLNTHLKLKSLKQQNANIVCKYLILLFIFKLTHYTVRGRGNHDHLLSDLQWKIKFK